MGRRASYGLQRELRTQRLWAEQMRYCWIKCVRRSNIIYSIFQMGQSTLQCEAKPGTPRDLFSQQLAIYQWRADPNHNTYVARVSFKNAYTQKQQQKFAQFLRQQQQEDYLEIYRFREQVQDFRNLSSEEVIVFEKYACTLTQLTATLPIQQALYLLHALLLGFEELRKIYEKIVVEEECCFVTNEGEVRAWINPNPRSNQVWTGQKDQLRMEVNIRAVLMKIVGIAERTAIRTAKSDEFFSIANSMLSSSHRHCYYADLRRVINEFCYLNNIQMSNNLLDALKLKEGRSICRIYKRDQSNIETSNPYQSYQRDKLVYLPTTESESNLQPNRSLLLLKSRSLQKHSQPPLLRQSSFIPHQHSDLPMAHTLPTVSQIVQTQGRTSIQACSGNFKKSLFLDRHIEEEIYSKSSNPKTQIASKQTPFSHPRQQHQQVLQVATNVQPKRSSKTQKNIKGRQTANREMLVSLVQNLPNNNQNTPPSDYHQQHPEMHHHRTHMDRYSTESKEEEIYWSRPWITTKTITKLISEHDQSLQNSIAESSDYYNDSVYSGALTHMGRDIAPPNADRSKTVRVSRDR